MSNKSDEFVRPKKFRNRKKETNKDGNYAEHPKHQPYVRCPTHNFLLEDDLHEGWNYGDED